MHKYHNAFLFEDKEKIESIEEKDGFLLVELKDTIFYPGGGGQPCDTGSIKTDSFSGKVVEVYKDHKIIHKVKPEKGSLKRGDKVKLMLNKKKREDLVRMHTGEHVLFKSIELNLEDVKLDKINLSEDESSLFIKAKDVTWEKLFKAEELVNKIIKDDREIIEKEYLKEDAVKLGKLRIKPDRIKSDTIRVVEVKDFDWSACAGTHARSTGFIENLLITKFNFVKGSWEVRFRTGDDKEIFELAKIARETATLLKSDTSEILEEIERLQQEADAYKERFREMSYKLLDFCDEEKIGDITLISNVVEDVEKKQLTDKAVSLLEEKTLVCFVNKTDDKAVLMLSASDDLKIDIPKLMNKILSKFNGRGGGRGSFAMGATDKKHADRLIPELKKNI